MDETGIKNISAKWAATTKSTIKGVLARAGKSDSRLYNLINLDVVTSPDGNIFIRSRIPKYAIFVDRGRRAYGADKSHDPPVRTIRDWLARKGLPHNPYAVARKIGRDGIKPIPFLKHLRNLKGLVRDLSSRWKEYVAEGVRDVGDVDININN